MSLRTVLPLVAMLGLIAPFPATAQVDSAPMPRAKPPVMVWADSFFQVEVPAGIHGSCDSTPVAPIVIHFRPVPMPRAIVEIFGNIEFGYFEIDGGCAPVTIFRPAPPVRTTRLTSMPATESAFTWNYHSPPPPPMPRAIIEVMGEKYLHYHSAHPVQIIRAPQMTTQHPAGGVDAPGGWWLDEGRVPQPKGCASKASSPLVLDEPSVSNNWWEPCDRGTAISTKDVAPMLKPAQLSPGRLSGTWYREIEGAVFSATFCSDELKLCMTQRDEGNTIYSVLTADYAITKEGLVHGVVTGVDIDVKRDPRAAAGGLCVMPPAAIAAELQKFVDSPFSFRTKTTSAGVMVSNLKFAAEGMHNHDVALVCGMFKPAPNGKLPAPRDSRSSAVKSSHCEPYSCPPVVASPYQPVPTTGTTPRESMPVVPAGAMIPPPIPQSFAPPKPGNVPAGEFDMMSEVFGQMLGAKTQPRAEPAPVPPPVVTTAPVLPMVIPTPPRSERPR